MSVTVIATPAAADANSYATVAEADAYHANHVWSETWEDADTDTKGKALIMATMLIDSRYSWGNASIDMRDKTPRFAWTGAASTEAQALAWPRTGMLNRNGYAIPSGEIPLQLKYATSEFARQLLSADRTADNDVEAQGITSLKAGPVSLSFKDAIYPKVMPDAAVNLLIPTWYTQMGASSVFGVL